MVELLCSAVIEAPIGQAKLHGGPMGLSRFTSVYLVQQTELLSDREVEPTRTRRGIGAVAG